MPIRDAEELADWIKANTPEPDPRDTYTSSMDQARWFVAVQEARAFHADYRLKDTASMFMDGESFGPVDEAYVTEWLDCGNTGTEDELIAELRRHFGLTP